MSSSRGFGIPGQNMAYLASTDDLTVVTDDSHNSIQTMRHI